MIHIEVEELTYLIVNVYGPNDDNPEFYIDLFELIEQQEEPNYLIGGDLNVTLDPLLDSRGSSDNHKRKREIINSFMDLQNVTDIWRAQNPDKFQFSWKPKGVRGLNSSSRLDYFLLSEALLSRAKAVEMKGGFQSDHSRVDLLISLAKTPRGKGLWKFNSSLLMDQDFVQRMNTLIEQNNWAVKENITPGQEWEYLKLEISNLATSYSINKAKGKKNLIEVLEHKRAKLEEQMLNAHEDNMKDFR